LPLHLAHMDVLRCAAAVIVVIENNVVVTDLPLRVCLV
jgi:hypothetical protein